MSKLYCYFNENGDLLESIADGSVRRGSSGIDSIYVYWDEHPNINILTSTYFKSWDNSISNEEQETITTVKTKIPPIKNQDLKEFLYGRDYQFIVIELPEFDGNGSCGLTLKAYEADETIHVLGTILFTVENSIAKLSPEITKSEYDYLMYIVLNKSSLYVHTLTGDTTWQGEPSTFSIKVLSNKSTSLAINELNTNAVIAILPNTTAAGWNANLGKFGELHQGRMQYTFFPYSGQGVNYTIDFTEFTDTVTLL